MERIAAWFGIVTLFVGVGLSPALAQDRPLTPARQDAVQPGSGRTLSLTVRLRPGDLVKAATDLARMVSSGSMVGVPFIQNLSRALSAEVAMENGATGADASVYRMSSDAWVRRSQAEGSTTTPPGPDSRAKARTNAPAESQLSIDAKYATVMAIVGNHAAAITSGAEALRGKLPDDRSAALDKLISQARTVAGELARTAQAAYDQVRKNNPHRLGRRVEE